MPVQLAEGTYYLRVHYIYSDDIFTGKINLKFSPVQAISGTDTITGELSRSEVRLYSAELTSSSYLQLKGSFPTSSHPKIEFIDAGGNTMDELYIYDSDWKTNTFTGMDDLDYKTKSLLPGKYYIRLVNGTDGNLPYSINVDTKIITTSIKINKKSVTLKKGKSIVLNATKVPSSSTDTITWTSSNKKVASVSQTGKVTAKKKGKCTIIATASNGVTSYCKIKVK